MPTPRVLMSKIRQALQLLADSGLSMRQVASAPGVSKTTVSEIAMYARDAGVDWPLASTLSDDELQARLYSLSRVEWQLLACSASIVGVTDVVYTRAGYPVGRRATMPYRVPAPARTSAWRPASTAMTVVQLAATSESIRKGGSSPAIQLRTENAATTSPPRSTRTFVFTSCSPRS